MNIRNDKNMERAAGCLFMCIPNQLVERSSRSTFSDHVKKAKNIYLHPLDRVSDRLSFLHTGCNSGAIECKVTYQHGFNRLS
jgi:hypothetical protein